jgi:hypothetical protein
MCFASIVEAEKMNYFADVAILLFAGHWVGDYWVQTDWQAATKPNPGWDGREACAWHVLTYTATLWVFLVLGMIVLNLPLTGLGILISLGVSAATHYFADRRAPLRTLHRLVHPRGQYWDNGGQPFLDQSWHLGWLTICAMLAVSIR